MTVSPTGEYATPYGHPFQTTTQRNGGGASPRDHPCKLQLPLDRHVGGGGFSLIFLIFILSPMAGPPGAWPRVGRLAPAGPGSCGRSLGRLLVGSVPPPVYAITLPRVTSLCQRLFVACGNFFFVALLAPCKRQNHPKNFSPPKWHAAVGATERSPRRSAAAAGRSRLSASATGGRVTA